MSACLAGNAVVPDRGVTSPGHGYRTLDTSLKHDQAPLDDHMQRMRRVLDNSPQLSLELILFLDVTIDITVAQKHSSCITVVLSAGGLATSLVDVPIKSTRWVANQVDVSLSTCYIEIAIRSHVFPRDWGASVFEPPTVNYNLNATVPTRHPLRHAVLTQKIWIARVVPATGSLG